MGSVISLPFALEEYRGRVTKVQEEMGRRGLDLLMVFWPENMYYLTGYQTLGYHTFQALMVPGRGDPFFLVRRINRQAVLDLSWLGDAAVFEDTEDPIEGTARLLVEGGWLGRRIGMELDAWFLTTRHFLALRERLGSGFSPADGSQIVNRLRLIKSDAELEYVRRAARAAEASTEAAVQAIRPGVRECDVAAEMHRALFRAGSDYLGHPPILGSGARAALNMVGWTDRVIQRDEPVQLEPGGCVQRYHAVFLRTVFTGRPDPELVRLSDVSLEQMAEGIAHMRPGITAGELHDRIKAPARKAGLGHLAVSRAGYSIGIGFPPDWGEGRTQSIKQDDPTVLEPNMVFHLTPVLWHARCLVGSSETVRVSQTGCEVLTRYPRELIVRA
jgi:Xaa-Pro dipeptidase